MKRDFKELQTQLMGDITHTETILSAAKELVAYLNMDPKFYRELELTSCTLDELLRRTAKTFDPEQLEPFLLSVKQVRMMATDLLDDCKRNMTSA